MEMNCDYCGRPLDEFTTPYTVNSRIGGGWEAYHDYCLKAYEGWQMMVAQHDSWCHLEGCDRTPANPFGRVELWK